MPQSYESLPENLPVPVDDGACDHLPGTPLPNLALNSTIADRINLAAVSGKSVIYCYPMTGVPGVALPDGWDNIPGARGCTPQSLAYKDRHDEILSLDAKVFGISAQSTDYQKEMAERLSLPFPVLSDEQLEFCTALRIPTFSVDGMQLMKRVTLIADDGKIEAVHYPVFPSDSDPQWAIDRLTANRQT